MAVPWRAGGQVTVKAPCALRFGVSTPAGERKERGAGLVEEDGEGYLSYRKRWRPAPSSHLGRVKLMQDSGTQASQMQRWVACTRVIATILFTYPQVHEYGSFHFCARRLAMCLSIASASTPRRPSTEAKKGVKCRQ